MKKTIPDLFKLQLDQIFFIALVAVAFLIHNYFGFDYFWHLEAGEFLANYDGIPATDPFSFTQQNSSWVLHEWLFELGLYHLYQSTGHYSIKLFATATTTLSLYIVYRAAVENSGSRLLSASLAAIAFIALVQYALPRPQVVTYLFFAIYLYLLLGYKRHPKPLRLVWLPIIMLLWVNIHGGYLVGIVLFMLFIGAEIVDRLFLSSRSNGKRPPLPPLVTAFFLTLSASLLNPYTYNQWIYPFQVLSMSASDLIVEWHSPDFHNPINLIYLIYFLVFFIISAYGRRTPRPLEILLPAFFILMSLVSNRHIPIALLALVPFYATAVRNIKLPQPSHGSLFERITMWFLAKQQNMGRGRQLGNLEYLLNWSVLAVILATTAVLHTSSLERSSVTDNKSLPVEAVAFIKKTGISGNVLNDYAYGGYLLYQLYPDSKVFIDGRADLYGDKFLQDYLTIYAARDEWQKLLAPYSVDYALLSNTAPVLGRLLDSGEFIMVYRDNRNSILVRNNERFRQLIGRYRIAHP